MYYENIQLEVSHLKEYLNNVYKHYKEKIHAPTERYIRKQVEAEADSGRNLSLEFQSNDEKELAQKLVTAVRSKQFHKITVGDCLIIPTMKFNDQTFNNWRFDITGINSYNGIGSDASLVPGIVLTSHNTTFNAVWPDVKDTNYNSGGYMYNLGAELATQLGLGSADNITMPVIKSSESENEDDEPSAVNIDDKGMAPVASNGAVTGLNWASHYFGQQRQAEWLKNHVFLLGEQEVGNPQNTFTAGNANSCQFLPMFKRAPIYRVKEAQGSTTRNTWWTASRDSFYLFLNGNTNWGGGGIVDNKIHHNIDCVICIYDYIFFDSHNIIGGINSVVPSFYL